MSNFDWPLNDSHFTMWDRLRIAGFFLNTKNRWTQGERVKEYEAKWRDFVGSKYAVMTSSGSTANTLMAMYVKDSLGSKFRRKNKVLFPAVTWTTSVAPWIREGFDPVFIDIQQYTLCMDTFKAHEYIETKERNNSNLIACIFPTSLLGMHPNMGYLTSLKEFYPDIQIMMDNCEASFNSFAKDDGTGMLSEANLSSLYTSSMSMYFGHQSTTGGEGGMIFTNDQKEYEYFLMARNHGMVRGLYGYPATQIQDYMNLEVDSNFDFNMLGNNYRSSDIAAFMGSLDFEKIEKHIAKRKILSDLFAENLPKTFFQPHHFGQPLFSLPIISTEIPIQKVKEYCQKNKIEYRPIISGNLLNHTAYQGYKEGKFPIAEQIHKNGIYVGLYPNLSALKVKKLTDFLNEISN